MTDAAEPIVASRIAAHGLPESRIGGVPASALDRWKVAGLVEVTLPSGFRVRGVVPTVEMLMLNGGIPGTLQDVALRFATIGVNLAVADPDAQGQFMQFARKMAAAFVRELWDDQAEAWVPVTLTADDFETFDQLDVDVLEELALRQKTPAQINGTEGGPGPIEAWAEFRREPEGTGAGEDGGAVQPAADDPAPRPSRSSRRARGKPGARPSPGSG